MLLNRSLNQIHLCGPGNRLGPVIDFHLFKNMANMCLNSVFRNKEYIGNLTANDDTSVEISIAGTPYKFTKLEIANVRLRIS